jgi:hypothetical protein
MFLVRSPLGLATSFADHLAYLDRPPVPAATRSTRRLHPPSTVLNARCVV